MNQFYEYRADNSYRAGTFGRVAFAVDDIARVTIEREAVTICFKSQSPIVLDGIAADNFQLWWDDKADVHRY
jgi:Fe-S cluster assembly ATPase SufC